MAIRVSRKQWAIVLIILTLAMLSVTVWLFLEHRPPMGRPGPPPGDPGMIMDEFYGPRHMQPELKMALSGVLLVLITLCTVAVVILLKKPAPSPIVPLQPVEPAKPKEPSSISFKMDYKTINVPLDDIQYIESMSEYVKIYLESQAEPLVVLYSLKRLVEELPATRFMRIHRSYIVALDRIRKANATSVVLDSPVTLPVGESYRPAFRKYLRTR